MRSIGLAVALVLGACTPLTQSAQSAAPYRLIDLSREYSAFFDRTTAMSTGDRVAAFSAQVAPLFPQFYRPGRDGAPDTQEGFDRRVARSLDAFPAARAGYTRAAAELAGLLNPAIASFRNALPDLGQIGDVYLVHSLGEMDGGTRSVDGVTYFIFGADMIARFHPPGTERPFFHHELFHIYNHHYRAECAQVWCSLWAEGAAVLAAEELNPGATDDQLLLTIPESVRPAVDAHLQEAVCAVRARLDGEAGGNELFGFGRLNADLPPRFGYYVGYLVARHARQTHSLQQIAHMNAQAARAAVDAGLVALAMCP